MHVFRPLTKDEKTVKSCKTKQDKTKVEKNKENAYETLPFLKNSQSGGYHARFSY